MYPPTLPLEAARARAMAQAPRTILALLFHDKRRMACSAAFLGLRAGASWTEASGHPWRAARSASASPLA
ncbi:MAG: hypothetical protein OJF55_001212 [Rhodanobacteraceae bacterium]|nr:MAG: hypothetical protein OJF55_001212 [Rhodanobacteraceae bacterium]